VLPGCYVHLGEGEYYSFLCPSSAQVFAAFGERDYRIVWRGDSSNESGLRCPLSAFPDWDDAYYELQLHVANDLGVTIALASCFVSAGTYYSIS
jgi:hypothetical protein